MSYIQYMMLYTDKIGTTKWQWIIQESSCNDPLILKMILSFLKFFFSTREPNKKLPNHIHFLPNQTMSQSKPLKPHHVTLKHQKSQNHIIMGCNRDCYIPWWCGLGIFLILLMLMLPLSTRFGIFKNENDKAIKGLNGIILKWVW